MSLFRRTRQTALLCLLLALILHYLPQSTAAEHMICMNGGSWTGQICICPNGFTGDRCQDVTPVVHCQNGGTWDGLKCQCTKFFYGQWCEQVEDMVEIEEPTVTASVGVSVTVTSQDFTEDLKNTSSEEFSKFNKTFTEQMAMIYAGIPEYEGVIIKSLSKGSIVVDYDVILRAPYTPEYENTLDNVVKNLETKIKNATTVLVQTNDTCSALLCFNSTATRVQETVTVNENPEEACKKEAGEGFAEYITLGLKGDRWYCITPCTAGYSTSKNCTYGKCQLQRSGPQCLCLTTDTHWYSGENCDWGIQKSLVYGLVGAAVAVLLVILAVLFVFSIRYRREARRQKSRVNEMFKWGEEDGRGTPGTFHNIGFELSEEGDNYLPLDSMYSNFQPSLSHIDPENKNPDSEAAGSCDIIVNANTEAVLPAPVELRTEDKRAWPGVMGHTL
ncbi:Mucin 3, intestinal [Apodemus speciosus]|uniref:Mucin 3, intestinal n=1 Tax=Apodemus speciosus TaxID=105296 RepID=A0ABQ0ETG7_APOSI